MYTIIINILSTITKYKIILTKHFGTYYRLIAFRNDTSLKLIIGTNTIL